HGELVKMAARADAGQGRWAWDPDLGGFAGEAWNHGAMMAGCAGMEVARADQEMAGWSVCGYGRWARVCWNGDGGLVQGWCVRGCDGGTMELVCRARAAIPGASAAVRIPEAAGIDVLLPSFLPEFDIAVHISFANFLLNHKTLFDLAELKHSSCKFFLLWCFPSSYEDLHKERNLDIGLDL
ncbi:hypothetical protein Taro_036978, partial [Colocasia esculenta]|nr:hypothetical protein [Colocasia esculenta]